MRDIGGLVPSTALSVVSSECRWDLGVPDHGGPGAEWCARWCQMWDARETGPQETALVAPITASRKAAPRTGRGWGDLGDLSPSLRLRSSSQEGQLRPWARSPGVAVRVQFPSRRPLRVMGPPWPLPGPLATISQGPAASARGVSTGRSNKPQNTSNCVSKRWGCQEKQRKGWFFNEVSVYRRALPTTWVRGPRGLQHVGPQPHLPVTEYLGRGLREDRRWQEQEK